MDSKRDKCSGEECSSKLSGRHHAHPQKWSRELFKFFSEVATIESTGALCVCKACELNVRQSLKKRENGEPFRLRWQKRSVKCCIPTCTNKSTVDNHPFSFDEICECVGTTVTCEPSMSNPLCNLHYQMMYRHKNTSKSQGVSCCVCGAKRKHEHSTLATESSKFVPCPSPKLVESFLLDAVGFESHITEGDLLCFKCYKYFNQVIKSGACTLSTAHILAELSAKEVALYETVQSLSNAVGTSESLVQLALYKTALHVCKVIQSDQAILFPNLYKFFCSQLPVDIDSTVCISKYRLLTFIGSEFGDLISSFCHNKKTGTVFYRTKADFHALLSNALDKQCKEEPPPDSVEDLNNSVHKLAKHFVSKAFDASNSLVLDVKSYKEEVCSVCPELWELVCTLTRSVNESRGRKAAIAADTHAGKIKCLRRAYVLSVILFVTNSECSFPFHVLLADAVESNGGSMELSKILNRIGAVASSDTLKRVILSVSQERKLQGIQSLLVSGAFTVASTDNIDYLQSHAAVYAGNQHRSWHATSIQLVQPKPYDSTGERVRRRLFDATSFSATISDNVAPDPLHKLRLLLSRKRQERSSPVASPQQTTRSPLSKKVCRARTFAESRQLTGRAEVEAPAALSGPPTVRTRDEVRVPFSSFLVSSPEKEVSEIIHQLIFKYFILKLACSQAFGRCENLLWTDPSKYPECSTI